MVTYTEWVFKQPDFHTIFTKLRIHQPYIL